MNNEPDRPDQPIYSLVRGIINLDRLPVDYGNERRRLRVAKVRGLAYRRGFHDYRIVTGGLVVYPRLRVAEAEQEPTWETISSGLPGLDELLGGGLVAGAACLIAGPSGVGKSSLATQYVYAAARRGERSAVFVFDEHRETFLRRAEGIGLDVRPFVREGLIQVRQIDAGEISPGEFTVLLQQIVTEDSLRLVVIDSMNGYLNAMPQERLLRIHLHELLTYLGQQGILSLLTTTYHGVIETTLQQEVEFSYLADAVLLLRHFETRGEVRQAITVIKKRHGPHERTVREIRLTGDGIEVGPPLIAFSGVMSGRLRYEGERGDLMGQGDGGGG